MNAAELAAVIAAAFFAVAMCAAVYVLARLAGLIGAATSLVTRYQAGADDLLARSRATVERADAQLARTGALADDVDEVAASMSDLSEQVTAVADTARVIATGLGTPVMRLAAAGHGVRYALALRRSGQADGGPGLRGRARLQAVPESRGLPPAPRGDSDPAIASRGSRTRRSRETWRERTDRVRAARDRATRDRATRDRAARDRAAGAGPRSLAAAANRSGAERAQP